MPLEEVFNTILISVRDFSTSIVVLTNAEKDFWTAKMTPAEAPNATTRAFEASKDLLNSLARPVILPSGWVKFLVFKLRELLLWIRFNADNTSFSSCAPLNVALIGIVPADVAIYP